MWTDSDKLLNNNRLKLIVMVLIKIWVYEQ